MTRRASLADSRARLADPNVARATTRASLVAWFLVLLALTLTVRLANPVGWVGSDDSAYFDAAEHVLQGEPMRRVHHHYARMPMIVPVALSVRLFGASQQAVLAPTIVAATACVVLTVVLGRLVWGWWEGLCAATVVSVLPSFRLFSTIAYPDVHACFWATAAVVLAFGAGRARRPCWIWTAGVACGCAIGLGVATKIFTVPVVLAAAVIPWRQRRQGRRHVLAAYSSIVLGGMIAFFANGLFYHWAADDFWFKLHAIKRLQDTDTWFPSAGYYEAATLKALAWRRLTMLFHPSTSTWGAVAVAFWPAAICVALLNRRGRAMAIWCIATYLFVAFAPVNSKNGIHPPPIFDGRNILTACVPFALCFAWLARHAAALILRPGTIDRRWPILVTAIAAAAFTHPEALAGIRNPHTRRIGRSVEQAIVSTTWDADRDIFVHPSLYIRYRILFPEHLRSRLRVAVDGESPSWWRDAAVDITDRVRPLPAPDQAFLMATPAQLQGESEYFDYGVKLPREALDRWRSAPLMRFGDARARASHRGDAPGDGPGETLLILAGVRTEEPVLARRPRSS